MTQIGGYVLAGGESSRMKAAGSAQDKALMEFNGETLLQLAMRKVATACGNVSILCGPAARGPVMQQYGRAIADRVERSGPLGGIDAALNDAAVLQGAADGWVLVMPVDLPLLPAGALTAFVHWGVARGNYACVMQAVGRLQPLPMLLHTGLRTAVAAALQRGDHKLLPAIESAAVSCGSSLAVHHVAAQTAEGWFINVNTPEEMQRALAISFNEMQPSASE